MVNALNDMAKLAIKSHATRGKEVIEILEMLGGKNETHIKATAENTFYYINEYGKMYLADKYSDMSSCVIYTLEKFLEKYPYKVGDKVRFSDSNTPFTISRIWWDNNASELICTLEEQDIDVSSVDLQPYKEEAMDKASKTVFDANAQCCDISNKIIKKETMEEKGILTIDFTKDTRIADKVEVILGDYEFVLKDGKTYFVKKKPKYPKTYEECCKVLLLKPEKSTYSVCGLEYKRHLIVNFQRLLVCRDAYWKIAGEEMGLGKPLEPDWSNEAQRKYCIVNTEGNVLKWVQKTTNKILAFPTEEMRDAFYENFKELINETKELL